MTDAEAAAAALEDYRLRRAQQQVYDRIAAAATSLAGLMDDLVRVTQARDVLDGRPVAKSLTVRAAEDVIRHVGAALLAGASGTLPIPERGGSEPGPLRPLVA